MKYVPTKDLVAYLKSSYDKDQGLLSKLKRAYRPYICPFDDLLMSIPENNRVLDIGCGTGIFLQVLAEYRKPKSLAGIEINQSLLQIASSSLKRSSNGIPIRLETYNGTDLPKWVSQYQYVLLIDVLHHVPQARQEDFLVRLFDLLRPGSTLIIKDIDADDQFLAMCNQLHDLVFAREVVHAMGAKSLVNQLQKMGFQTGGISKRRMFVYSHYTIMAGKPE
jgi:2-polyprenyl-3-methyl-5-hydroxy-6-metoxy-1,4-benzoquinol methylase